MQCNGEAAKKKEMLGLKRRDCMLGAGRERVTSMAQRAGSNTLELFLKRYGGKRRFSFYFYSLFFMEREISFV